MRLGSAPISHDVRLSAKRVVSSPSQFRSSLSLVKDLPAGTPDVCAFIAPHCPYLLCGGQGLDCSATSAYSHARIFINPKICTKECVCYANSASSVFVASKLTFEVVSFLYA